MRISGYGCSRTGPKGETVITGGLFGKRLMSIEKKESRNEKRENKK